MLGGGNSAWSVPDLLSTVDLATGGWWDEISSVEFVRHGDFYDLSVPFWEHYEAHGLWHHNSGKTRAGATDLLLRSKPNRTYLVASPTGIMLSDTTLPMFRTVAQEFGLWGSLKLTPYPNVMLTTGAVVRFRTADNPERMRGPNLSGAWLDEASLMHSLAYDICLASLREAGEQGWLSATFTPRGPNHWTHAAFATSKPDTALFRASTGQNPFNPAGFAERLMAQWGDTNFARQELAGEFVQLEGAEFPGDWFARPDLWFDAWPETLILKIISLDPSKGTSGRGSDYQAHVLIGVVVEENRYVLYVDADLCREGVVDMCNRTAALTRRFNAEGGSRLVDAVVCEENATMGLLEPALDAASVRAGVLIPYLLRTNTDNKEFRIRYYLGPPLSRYQIRFRRTPGSRMVVGQAQSFPYDEHDDGIDALASGLRCVAEMLTASR